MITLCGCSRALNSATTQPTDAKASSSAPSFDANAAFDLLKKQVAFGPRCPGMPGHKGVAELITSELRACVDGVSPQRFSTTVSGKSLDMQNITAYINPEAKKWVLLAAHWDTRPTADMEVAPDKKSKPIPGANDGASGAAVLLQLAKMFTEHRPNVGVMLVFLDGEDYGPGEDAMFLGSRNFADNLRSCTKVRGKPVKIEYAILLDMIGDKDLHIYQEANSMKAAPEVVNKVWSAASKLGYKDQFISEPKYAVQDDHIPLIEAGVKCIDVIDFDYGPWHTLDDTPDKCSPQSLKAVGDVISHVVYEESGS